MQIPESGNDFFSEAANKSSSVQTFTLSQLGYLSYRKTFDQEIRLSRSIIGVCVCVQCLIELKFSLAKTRHLILASQ